VEEKNLEMAIGATCALLGVSAHSNGPLE